MTLTEFLATADVDDNVALAEANAYATTKVWRIEGAVRKTQVETTVIVNDTTDRLEASITALSAIGSPTATELAQLALSKAILRALTNLYNPEFYINLADPTVAGMFANAQALGVLNQAEIDGITAAATYNETPFAGITLAQVQDIRNPLVWTDCDHGLQTWLVSSPQTDRIRFFVTKSVAGGSVEIQTTWGVSNEAGVVQATINRITTLQCSDSNVATSDSRTRQQMDIPPEAKILRMKYKGRDIISVAVSQGQ
jgi:hypothetical protein